MPCPSAACRDRHRLSFIFHFLKSATSPSPKLFHQASSATRSPARSRGAINSGRRRSQAGQAIDDPPRVAGPTRPSRCQSVMASRGRASASTMSSVAAEDRRRAATRSRHRVDRLRERARGVIEPRRSRPAALPHDAHCAPRHEGLAAVVFDADPARSHAQNSVALRVYLEAVAAPQIHRGRCRRLHREPTRRRPDHRVDDAALEVEVLVAGTGREDSNSRSRADLHLADLDRTDPQARAGVGFDPCRERHGRSLARGPTSDDGFAGDVSTIHALDRGASPYHRAPITRVSAAAAARGRAIRIQDAGVVTGNTAGARSRSRGRRL